MDALRNLSSDVENIPDLKYIINTLTQIFVTISSDDMIEMKTTDKEKYIQTLYEKYPEFSEKYFSLFSVILDGELDSMTHLVMMIKTLCLVKTGQISMDSAFEHVREDLASKYIYPQFGGKAEFEKKIKQRGKKHN